MLTRIPAAWVGIVLALAMSLLVASCSDDESDGNVQQTTPPSWIESVSPLPNSTSTANTVVEVNHAPQDPEFSIRLIVDGIDVTASAQDDNLGLITYRQLDPGPHSVTVEQTWLPDDGQDTVVVDSYTWSFETL